MHSPVQCGSWDPGGSRAPTPGGHCPQTPHSTPPMGPARDSGLHHAGNPPTAPPGSLLASRFTASLDRLQPVPVGDTPRYASVSPWRHSRGRFSWILEEGKDGKMSTASLNICPASLLVIIKLMLTRYFGLLVAISYYSIYWGKSAFLTGTLGRSLRRTGGCKRGHVEIEGMRPGAPRE